MGNNPKQDVRTSNPIFKIVLNYVSFCWTTISRGIIPVSLAPQLWLDPLFFQNEQMVGLTKVVMYDGCRQYVCKVLHIYTIYIYNQNFVASELAGWKAVCWMEKIKTSDFTSSQRHSFTTAARVLVVPCVRKTRWLTCSTPGSAC